MRLYDGGIALLIVFITGLLIGSNVNHEPKGEVETTKPVTEETYDEGLYENGQ